PIPLTVADSDLAVSGHFRGLAGCAPTFVSSTVHRPQAEIGPALGGKRGQRRGLPPRRREKVRQGRDSTSYAIHELYRSGSVSADSSRHTFEDRYMRNIILTIIFLLTLVASTPAIST